MNEFAAQQVCGNSKQHLAFFTSDCEWENECVMSVVCRKFIDHAYSVEQAWNFLNNSATILAGQP